MKDYHMKVRDEFKFNRASDESEDGTFQYILSLNVRFMSVFRNEVDAPRCLSKSLILVFPLLASFDCRRQAC